MLHALIYSSATFYSLCFQISPCRRPTKRGDKLSLKKKSIAPNKLLLNILSTVVPLSIIYAFKSLHAGDHQKEMTNCP